MAPGGVPSGHWQVHLHAFMPGCAAAAGVVTAGAAAAPVVGIVGAAADCGCIIGVMNATSESKSSSGTLCLPPDDDFFSGPGGSFPSSGGPAP